MNGKFVMSQEFGVELKKQLDKFSWRLGFKPWLICGFVRRLASVFIDWRFKDEANGSYEPI